MDLAAIELELRQAAGVLVVDPRVVRSVIKQHRGASGLVPHGRCYTILRDALLPLVTPGDLPLPAGELAHEVILLARPSAREISGRDRDEVMTRLWRTTFHARIHQALQRRVVDGSLDDATLRARINRLGQTEFDEVRSILRHDDVVLPPYSDMDVYIEFAALYLEQRYFAPSLLVANFPGLTAYARVEETLAQDLDVPALLGEGRPRTVASPATTRQLHQPSMLTYVTGEAESPGAEPRAVSHRQHASMLRRAGVARAKGNDVRAMLLCAQAEHVDNIEMQREAQTAGKEALRSLTSRLATALRGEEGYAPGAEPNWRPLLMTVVERAARERLSRFSVEGRLLYGLQLVAMTFEREHRAVDLPGWILSLGKRSPVRTLHATRELRASRYLHQATQRVRYLRIANAEKKLLAKLMQWASSRAEDNIRGALRPKIHGVLQDVELLAESGPERLARDKLVEELLDQIVARGYLSFAALRDAISRNQLKLDDLSGAGELWKGDSLLLADKAFETELDGIYRRGDIYLRGLQKVSSLPFGTNIGRLLTLWVILPLGASFVILEGATHIVGPVLKYFKLVAEFNALTIVSFAISTILLLALIHSAPFRAFTKQLFSFLGLIFATVFFRLPRAFLRLPPVRRWFARPWVRRVLRQGLLPLLVAALVYTFVPLVDYVGWLRYALAGAVFGVVSGLMGTRVGIWVEDFIVDQLAPRWRVFSRQWLPGLFRMISQFFRMLMELIERAIYRVDEVLRFSEGNNPITLVFKALVGLVWAIVAYVIRLYITLLVEPEINPLKHFPTVTVAHKLMISVTPTLIVLTQRALAVVVGDVIAGAVAVVTIFLLPSVFGFLAWELKENYKLYRATLPEGIPSARVGLHGETMRGLLLPGFHSGTLPKLYEKLRRAARREEEGAWQPGSVNNARAVAQSLTSFRHGIRQVERAVRHFIERELIHLLKQAPRWTYGDVKVVNVALSSNRIRVRMKCKSLSPEACELTFEEQSGYLVAGIPRSGFAVALQEASETGAILFENALAGLYQRAEVDLVREQIEGELGEGVDYDISDEGLLVWPEDDYRCELVYPLGKRARTSLEATVRGAPAKERPPILDSRHMLFANQKISWLAWVNAWGAAEREDAEITRLLRGTSLLPQSERSAAASETPTASFQPVAVTRKLE